jgi:tetratricopeptide (TPR) repeat protein
MRSLGLAALASVVVISVAAPLAAAPTTVDAGGEVTAAVYAAPETQSAFEKQADAKLRAQRAEIDGLREKVRALGDGAGALRAQLRQQEQQFVADLAARDRAYAAAIEQFRGAVADIAGTPAGAAALAQYNAGHEVEALAVRDRISAANDAARRTRANIESAVEKRRNAELALAAHSKNKAAIGDVIALYETVTRLDPGVFQDWIELSRLYMDAGRLADATRAVRSAQGVAANDRDRSVALNYLGGALLRAGDLAGADKAYGEDLAITRKLAAADPGDAEAQRDVSASLQRLAYMRVKQGDLAGAVAAYGEALEIARKLAAGDPGNAQAQRDVSANLEEVGEVRFKQGDLAGADTAYAECLSIRRKLAAADPGNAEAQRDLLETLWTLAKRNRPGVHWRDVVARLEDLEARGALAPTDRKYLDEARKNAAAEKGP